MFACIWSYPPQEVRIGTASQYFRAMTRARVGRQALNLGGRAIETPGPAFARIGRTVAPVAPSAKELSRLGAAVSAAFALWLLALTLPTTIGMAAASTRLVGDDFALYKNAAASWLARGEFYPQVQLAGPWAISGGAILYPPVTLWILVPFTVLPPVLWWAFPAVAIAWALWRIRPGPLSWPVMAFLIGFSPLPVFIRAGNPMIWALAALFVGCAKIGPSIFVLLKPSLAPFALFGIWDRRWWVWAAAFTVLCMPFGWMWLDWARSLLSSDGTLAYSYREIGPFLVPLAAWAGRRQGHVISSVNATSPA